MYLMSPSPVVTVEFDPTSYTVSESSRFANITVVKRGQTTQAVSVDFFTLDRTARGTDCYASWTLISTPALNRICANATIDTPDTPGISTNPI